MRFPDSVGDYDRIDPNMTSMIDVCFMILIFFIANMRIFLPEGDFCIKMPATAAPQKDTSNDEEMPLIQVRLQADEDGKLTGIQMGERKLHTIKELQSQIRDLVEIGHGAAGPSSAEVEIDCDYNLKFEYAMDALTAISGYLADDKQTVIPMIENIRFSPPRKPNS